jgi:hypothetical protein
VTNSGPIDVHHHIVPPDYRDWLISRGEPAGGMPIPRLERLGRHRIHERASGGWLAARNGHDQALERA